MGFGKASNRAESQGLAPVGREAVKLRLKKLREYRWSSYRAYAGDGAIPKWLTTRMLLERGGGREAYRKHIQQHVTRGDSPEGYEDFAGRVALGSQEFLAKVKDLVGRVTKEQPDRAQVLKRVTAEDVVKVVEQIRGEGWAEFVDRQGDWGRDLALYLVRRRSGLPLRAIGAAFGMTEYKTVAAAIKRFELSLLKDATKRILVKKCLLELQKVET